MGKFYTIMLLMVGFLIQSHATELNIKLKIDSAFALIDSDKINDASLLLDSCQLFYNKNPNGEGVDDFYFLLTSVNYLQNNNKTAIEYFEKAISYPKYSGNDTTSANLLYMAANSYLTLSNYTKAVELALLAKKTYSDLGLEKQLVKCKNLLGSVFYYLGQLELAEKYFTEVKKHAAKSNDTILILTSLNNLANIICDKGNDNRQAIKLYNTAIKYSIQINDPELYLTYINLAIIHQEINNIDSSRLYVQLALNHTPKTDTINLAYIYFTQGQNQYLSNKTYKSQASFKKSLDYAMKIDELDLLLSNYDMLSKIHSIKNDFEKAFQYSQKSIAIRDSISEKNHIAKINELTTNYNNQQKDIEAELQAIKIKAQQNNLKEQRYKNIVLLFAIALIGLVLILIFYYSHQIRIKNKRLKTINSKLNQQNVTLNKTIITRDKLLSTIAHDIKNPLGTINGFAELLIMPDAINDKQKIELYGHHIFVSSTNLFTLLENLVNWVKMQKDSIHLKPEYINTNELIRENITLLKEMAAVKNIEIINNCPNQHQIFVDKQTINTAVRNLINNAIKFTPENGSIKIHSELCDNNIQIHFEDTGVGIKESDIPLLFDQTVDKNTVGPQVNKGSGLGLTLCYEFIKMNNGKIKVSSEINNGSCFTIQIPTSNK